MNARAQSDQFKDAKMKELEGLLAAECAKTESMVKERARNKERIQNLKLEMEDRAIEYQAREQEHKS